MSDGVKAYCQHCKIELPANHTGECLNCHITGKHIVAVGSATVGIKATASATKTSVRNQLINRSKSEIIADCLIDGTVGFVGLMIGIVVEGGLGALIGFIIGLAIGITINITVRGKRKETTIKIEKF
jgi:hypothetical protein